MKKQTLNLWAVVNPETGETCMDSCGRPVVCAAEEFAKGYAVFHRWNVERVTVTIEPIGALAAKENEK